MPVDQDQKPYSTVLFIDSMVILEAKPLATLPWAEIDPSGPILILLVPQVLKEVDKRKRDGRLGKRAREFSRAVAATAETGLPTRISNGPPAIDLMIAVCGRLNWDALDDLDPDEGDSRVIAQVLHARDVPSEARLLLSQDTNVIAGARRHGLQTKRLPDHWLLDPEPSPADKEVQRLKARIGELEASEPKLSVKIGFGGQATVRVIQVEPLSSEEQGDLVKFLIRTNPSREERPSLMSLHHDYSYHERYETYCRVTLPQYAEKLHTLLEELHNQLPISIEVENCGSIPAENVIVEVNVSGGTISERFILGPILGPSAPKPKQPWDTIAPLHSYFQNQPAPHRNEVFFPVAPRRAKQFEAHCQDFRHGRKWRFNGFAHLFTVAEEPFVVSIRLTASNLHNAVPSTLEVKKLVEQEHPHELINPKQHQLLKPFPVQALLDEASDESSLGWIEQVELNDDEPE
jgi:hypothetical protein